VISGTNAGFGRRTAALLYDALLLAGILMIYTAGALYFAHKFWLAPGKALERSTVGAWFYLYQAGEVALIAGYALLNWTRSGQTLGMRAWHLRAVTEAGRPLDLKAAASRFALGVLAWAPAALGVLWLYADREHLALHDRLSKTRVVHLQSQRVAER
jgi:uncharacterized RDD family membrane protein YckC